MVTITRGIRANNPGNIERVKGVRWQGVSKIQRDERFINFDSPEYGIRAIARILITYQDSKHAKNGSKIDTVREIIERWAPATENNTDAYSKHVAKVVQVGENDAIDVYDHAIMKALVIAITKHENAGYTYPDAVIDKGLALAGVVAAKKMLKSSRTLNGGKIAATGTVSGGVLELAEPIMKAKESLAPMADTMATVRWIILALTLAGIGLMIYAYIDDRNKRIT